MENQDQENQLAVIVKDSGLDKTKSQILLDQFSNYFEIAATWESKAKTLIVTDVSQKTEMKMAREGRLFLKAKRIDIEKSRKELKEQSLREGQTIDAIAKILKNLIEPIEQHLEKQEKFAEIKEKEMKEERKATREATLTELNFDYAYTDLLNMPDAQFDELVLKIENEISAKQEADRLAEEQRVEAERKAESERIEKERLQKEENEKIRIENERLQKEAKDREEQLKKERKEAEAKRIEAEKTARAERELIEEKARKEREEQAEIIRKEREERECIEREVAAKKQEEDRIVKANELAKKKAAAAPDKEKLTALIASIKALEMPVMATNEAVAILVSVDELMGKVCAFIEQKRDQL